MGGGIEYRFWYLGWSIDLAYGRYLVTDDADFLVSSTTTHITTSLKGYVPFDTFDAFLGFGLGYGDQTVTEEQQIQASWSILARSGYRGCRLDYCLMVSQRASAGQRVSFQRWYPLRKIWGGRTLPRRRRPLRWSKGYRRSAQARHNASLQLLSALNLSREASTNYGIDPP